MLDSAAGDKPIDLRDMAIWELFYSSGVRVSELAGMNTDDWDPEGQLIKIRGKGSKTRIIPLGKKASSAERAAFLHGSNIQIATLKISRLHLHIFLSEQTP